ARHSAMTNELNTPERLMRFFGLANMAELGGLPALGQSSTRLGRSCVEFGAVAGTVEEAGFTHGNIRLITPPECQTFFSERRSPVLKIVDRRGAFRNRRFREVTRA